MPIRADSRSPAALAVPGRAGPCWLVANGSCQVGGGEPTVVAAFSGFVAMGHVDAQAARLSHNVLRLSDGEDHRAA